jgi:hypothetical protein
MDGKFLIAELFYVMHCNMLLSEQLAEKRVTRSYVKSFIKLQ